MNGRKMPAHGRTDWHCHLLPGVDDGPATMEEALAMAAVLRQAGYTAVCCTPHLIRGVFDAGSGAIRSAVAALQRKLAEEHIDLKLFPGREYYLDEFLLDNLKDPLLLGGTRSVLIEIPDHLSPDFVRATFFQIRCGGLTPVIAHPERCRLLAMAEKEPGGWLAILAACARPSPDAPARLLAYLQEIDCGFQGNLGSFLGHYGEDIRERAANLWETGGFSCFGTDAHSRHGIEAVLRSQAGRAAALTRGGAAALGPSPW